VAETNGHKATSPSTDGTTTAASPAPAGGESSPESAS